MLDPGTNVFLLIPDGTEERVLHPATVVRAGSDLYVAELAESQLSVAEGLDVFLFRERDRTFTQQHARIQSVDVENGKTHVSFKTTGEPVSAESRDCYRVSAIGTEISATFGPEEDCRVLDVSATGFSVCACQRYAIGSRVDAVLRFEGDLHRGTVVIQSARPMDAERLRYGVYCLDDKQPAAGLRAALPRINLAIQRQLLQRRSGLR